MNDPLTQLSLAVPKNPAYMLPFLRAVAASNVWIAGRAIAPFEPDEFVELRDKISLYSLTDEDGKTCIPFYSDCEKVQLLDHPKPYIGIPAHMLFQITRGTTLIFNYLTDFSIRLTPDVIDLFLSGQYTAFPSINDFRNDRFLMHGSPEPEPQELVDALTKLFINRSTVKKAFLTARADLLTDGESELFVGILVDRPDATIAADVRRVVVDAMRDSYPARVLWLNEQIVYKAHSTEVYMMSEEAPFYQRSKTGRNG